MAGEFQLQGATGLEIAVIGMAGRFPGARDIDEFWENLKKGVESVHFYRDEELEMVGVSEELLGNPNYVKAGARLEGFDTFDSQFFGYSPHEAEVMDPQVRLFHECAWQALEDAAVDPAGCEGLIGLYAGANSGFHWQSHSLFSPSNRVINGFAADQLRDKDYLVCWVSYKLDLKGPSCTVQTACSTSLVAIHLACQGLLNAECDMALAGGVSLSARRIHGYMYQEGMIYSPDGHCRTFDAGAQGTIFGDGIGVVVLKRLTEAAADRDHIYAVIKGSSVNNDGASKVGFTAPSIEGQADVIRAALHMAEVDPETIQYVEAHGTATPLGDPIEIEALTRALGVDKRGYCGIGSVKSNVGHLHAAAGVAGFIKTVLALTYRQIPPSLHFKVPNPRIDFENSPFYVNTRLNEWKNGKYPLRAGVSSFGIGGTNAHVVLEEWPAGNGLHGVEREESPSRQYQLILLSAETPTALDRLTENLADYLEKNPDVNLADAAYTLQTGRRAFKYRRLAVCSDVNEAAASLSSPDSGKTRTFWAGEEDRPVVFMFPGQGSQYVNMGLGLYQAESLFREEMDRCFDILSPIMDDNIKEILYPTGHFTKEGINRTEVAQPVLFIFEYALARLLMNWGIKPAAMIGHSIGEYVAACLSGVFSLEDALHLVASRGQLMQQMPPGAMMGVVLPEEELRELLIHPGSEEISIAAVNGVNLCTVSGPAEAISAFEDRLKRQGYETRPLHTSHAFHSGMMEPVLKQFEDKAREFPLNAPTLPFISNLTGTWAVGREVTDPAYWAAHMRKGVRFLEGLKNLFEEEAALFLELGPGKVLTTFAAQYAKNHDGRGREHRFLNLVKHPRQSAADDAYLLDNIGRLWLYGKRIDWQGFYAGEKRHRLSLPAYPFEGRRYWPDSTLFPNAMGTLLGGSLLQKRKDIGDWFYIPSWKRSRLPRGRAGGEGRAGNCLVFTGHGDFCSRLMRQLEQAGLDIIAVREGTEFSRQNRQLYTLNPGEDGHYSALFEELRAGGTLPRLIVHLWNIGEDEPPALSPEGLAHSQDVGYYSLLNLARAIGSQDVEDKIRIIVISDRMQEVLGEIPAAPQKATLLGPVMVIPQEYPNISCRSIDIVTPQPAAPGEDILMDQLLAEMRADTAGAVVAYRSTIRWVRGYEPIRLEDPGRETARLKERGVYLITGGLGGIGLVLAEHLAQQVRARLVLTGRSTFPPPGEWDQWLESRPPEDNVRGKVEKIRQLEAWGAEVLVLSADVSDLQQMAAALKEAERRFGGIDGVIHAAGLPDAGLIQARGRDTTEEVFASKVRGTVVLDGLLKDRALDFFILCSSISAIHPPMGQVAYTAANAFLDSFSHYKSGEGVTATAVTSINWDVWQEVGMAAANPSPRGGILPAEGKEVFSRVLTEALPQVVTSTRNLLHVMEWSRLAGVPKSQAPLAKDVSLVQKYRRPALKTPYFAPDSELEKTLAGLWQDILGIDQVGVDDNFFDLGATSLEMIQVNRRLKEILGQDISLVTFYNHSTVAELARHLSKKEADGGGTGEDRAQLEAISKGKNKLRQRGKRMAGGIHA
jgi:acyl transferase domain-containing protein/acyl carrier protein